MPAAATSTGFKEQSTAPPMPDSRWTYAPAPSYAETAHLRQTMHPHRAPDNQPQFTQSGPPRPAMATANSYSNTMQTLVNDTMQKMLQSWYQTGYVFAALVWNTISRVTRKYRDVCPLLISLLHNYRYYTGRYRLMQELGLVQVQNHHPKTQETQE